MSEPLSRLVEHLAWADGAVIDSLKSQKKLPARVMEILSHVMAAEEVWISRIRNDRRGALPVWADLSLADCEELHLRNAEAFRKLVGPGNQESLQRIISYVNSKGERFESTLEDVLLQVCTHGSYHRGQIAALVRAGGGIPVNTDFITYARSPGGKKS